MKKIIPLFVLMGLLLGTAVINSCKKDPVIPTLSTAAVTNITVSSATSGGTITDDGGAEVSARGVCWATTSNPTVSGSKTSDATGSGSFTSNLTGLTPNTLYHIRGYATNEAGTAYGEDVSFTTTAIVPATLTTTVVSSITLTTAIAGGTVLTDGNATVSDRGVCWSLTENPTVSDSKTSDGTGTGAFTSNLTGLVPGSTYHVRAYAINSAGTAYGNDVTFTTNAIVVPTLTTAAITSITLNSAISGGNITADGGAAVTARGICWSTTANPTTANFTTTDAAGTGVFTSNMTGLLPGTTYHVRAYATNSAGTAYGNDLSFTTVAIVAPTLTTTVATGITQTAAISGGVITADGGGAITARGICWSTTADPTIADSRTTQTGGTGQFVSNITGLTSNTLYHARAYAINSAGTAYGNDITFTTANASLPVVASTTTPGSITISSATSGGNITSDGNGAITVRGVCWSISQNPTISDPTTTNGPGTGTFTSNISGLSPGTKYYVRAYATNSAGTAYGPQMSFNTRIADIDLNTYNTVSIGAQVWMAENLKVTRFSNGDPIPTVTGDISAEVEPKYQWAWGDVPGNVTIYGRLYTWYVGADPRNVCPTGWSVPTDTELQALTTFLGGESVAGAKLKSTGTTLWNAPNTGATNETGFTALPAGYRLPTGVYNSLGVSSYIWSSTVNNTTLAWGRGMYRDNTELRRGGYFYADGVSIRCIKD